MPRPTDKQSLLEAFSREQAKLEALLATLDADDMTMSGVVGDWSVKDVLAHLAEWHAMCLSWYAAGLRGEVPELPAPGYKWNQTPALNEQIYQANRDRPIDDVRQWFQSTQAEIIGTVQSLPDAVLFSPNQFAWTGKNMLGAYFVSATSSHYLWAYNEIRKGLKKRQTAD